MRFPDPVAALIFDVDGTLAETEPLHLAAFNATFAAASHDWAWSEADYLRLLTTTGGKERITRYLGEIGVPADAAAIAALYADKTARYAALVAGGIELRPGVAALIGEARARGIAVAVATTTAPANVDALVRSAWGVGAHEVFDVVAAGDEVPAKKPAPDVYLLALERLGLPASACVAFEDSRNGLRAAKAAGLFTVVTPARFTAHEDFSGADLLLPALRPLDELAAGARLMLG